MQILFCVLSTALYFSLGFQAVAAQKTHSAKARATASTTPEDEIPMKFFEANRLSVGGSASFISIPNSGLGIATGIEYARRLSQKTPIFIGVELQATRWDTSNTGQGAGSLFQEPTDPLNPANITAYSFLATVYYLYYELSSVHLYVGLSMGPTLIWESGRLAKTGEDGTIDYTRFQALIRLGLEFELAPGAFLRFEPRAGVLGSKSLIAPQVAGLLPF